MSHKGRKPKSQHKHSQAARPLVNRDKFTRLEIAKREFDEAKRDYLKVERADNE